MSTKEVRGTVELQGSETYHISVEYSSLSTFPDRKAADLGGGVLRIGACRVVNNSELIAEAVKLASSVDTVILCVGTDQERESEGFDRKDMK
jgi:beta-glucosidase